LEYPNAGSIFQNPDFKKIPFSVRNSLKNVVKSDPFLIVPAAYFISEAKLSGLRLGNVKISEKHPNFIVNLGNGKAEDVKKLIKLIKRKVKSKFGIELREEIELL
jgi:UDP-N-acetylmuramate dehydrogenase